MKEETKLILLKQLAEEFNVKIVPQKNAFSVKRILDRYMKDICEKAKIKEDESNVHTIQSALRKLLCLKYRVENVKNIPESKQKEAENELECFIKDYLLDEGIFFSDMSKK